MWLFYTFKRCWDVISFVYRHLVNLHSFICFLFLAGVWLVWCSWDGNCTCTVAAAVTKQTEYLCTYPSDSMPEQPYMSHSVTTRIMKPDSVLICILRFLDSLFNLQCSLLPRVPAIPAAHDILSIFPVLSTTLSFLFCLTELLAEQEASCLAPSWVLTGQLACLCLCH